MPALPRLLLAAIAFVLIGSSAGCGGSAPERTERADNAEPVRAGGVEVSAAFDGSSEVRVTFKPLRPGFHIYSLTMPTGGVDGLGIPTRVDAGKGIRATGAPESSVPAIPLRIPSLHVTLPVYPDGPVDVLLPVDAERSSEKTVIVSYGACSEHLCLMPVRDLSVPIGSPS